MNTAAATGPRRCGWALNELDIAYHDQEWGVPLRDDQRLFEFLVLEGAQAGLSWSTILKKRENYRTAFSQFDPEIVARFDDSQRQELLTNVGIVRNRQKIDSAIVNAQLFLKVQAEEDGFHNYIWKFVDGSPIQNRWKTMQDIPAKTSISDAMCKDLKRRGFKFVGSTICYAFMQATGMVNDHLITCFRHAEVARMCP